MERRTKINKWDLIKLKTFGTAKETINKTKRPPTEWEKIFVNDMTNKELISNTYICVYISIYIHLIQPNIKKNWFKSGQKI